MAFYSNEIIQQLKAQTDIAAVIECFLPLKRSGNGRYIGVCPFHNDRSPSMNVNPSLGIYKCFACGAAGDVFKFLEEHEKMDFKGAVEWVANFSHFTLPHLGAENSQVTEEREMVRRLNELAAQWFQEQLNKSSKALNYLNKRHITAETQKLFHIGYAPDGREGFISFAAKNGFSPKDCVKAGLAVEKNQGGISDKFRDRLMIAIQNISGMIVAFGGRDLSENKDPNFKPAKYMNSPESALYHKSDILFGLHQSRQSIAKENAVIIVEGYFDMISLYQSGVTNVVAASGTALTENHANILARYTKNAYLVFDGDAAGEKATLRSIEIILPKGIAPRVFALSRPDGTKIDPDNFINEKGAESFRQSLNTAEDWLSYLASLKNLQRPEEKADFVNYAKSLVKSIADRELKNQYLKLISERFNTDRSLAQVKPLKKDHYLKEVQTNPEVTIPWHTIPPIEIRFANLLLRNPTLMDRAMEYFDMEWAASGIQMFESSIVEEFVNTVIALYADTGYHSPQLFYENFSEELKSFVEGLTEEKWTPPQEIYEFYQTLMVLSTKLCDRQKKELTLDTAEKVQIRMEMTKFTQGMQTLYRMLNEEKISIDSFADQIIKSKAKLLQFQAMLLNQPYIPTTLEAQEINPPEDLTPAEPSEPSESREPSEDFEDEEYTYDSDEFNEEEDSF